MPFRWRLVAAINLIKIRVSIELNGLCRNDDEKYETSIKLSVKYKFFINFLLRLVRVRQDNRQLGLRHRPTVISMNELALRILFLLVLARSIQLLLGWIVESEAHGFLDQFAFVVEILTML